MQILTSSGIETGDREKLANRLSDISVAEPAMLGRPPDFYRSAIESNRLVVAVKDDVHDIVGSGLLLPLDDGWAEISGVFVRPDSRGHGIGNRIIEGVQGLAAEHGLRLLLTMKPNVHGSEWMILEAAKNGLVPTSYEFLRDFSWAFRSCCVCLDENGSEGCPDRDVSCVLWVDANVPGAKEHSVRFMKGGEFASAVSNTEMREKILNRVTERVWK